MAIKNRKNEKPTIDLNSSQGNAFSLIGYVKTFGKQIGFSQERIGEIREEMMSGDYDNLIKIFDREFGDYVDLIK